MRSFLFRLLQSNTVLLFQISLYRIVRYCAVASSAAYAVVRAMQYAMLVSSYVVLVPRKPLFTLIFDLLYALTVQHTLL